MNVRFPCAQRPRADELAHANVAFPPVDAAKTPYTVDWLPFIVHFATQPT